MTTTPKNTYTIFVDPDNLSTLVEDLKFCGFTNLKKGGAGPDASVTFKGTEEDVEFFVEWNCLELTEDNFIVDHWAED